MLENYLAFLSAAFFIVGIFVMLVSILATSIYMVLLAGVLILAAQYLKQLNT